MGLKNSKGFVHTLEAVIAASLLITTATVVIPQLQPDTSIEDTTQQNIFQGLQTLDKTGELRSDLSTIALKEEIEVLNPNEFNVTVLIADTDTESFKLEVEKTLGGYAEIIKIIEHRDWNQGSFNSTSADRNDNSGNLGLGYLNGTLSGQPNDNGLNNESLIGYWRLDDSDASDYSGYGANAVIDGPNKDSNGVFGTSAYKFDGLNDNISLGDSDRFSIWETGDTGTVSVWIKPKGIKSDMHVVSKDQEWGIHLVNNTAGNNALVPRFDVWGDNNLDEVGNDQVVPVGEWTHLAYTLDEPNNEIKTYVNGELIGTTPTTDSSPNSASVLCISAHDGGVEGKCDRAHFNGTVDEPRIYNRSLSETKIRRLYFSGQEGAFEGNYTDSYNLVNEEVPEKIQINSSNINSGNVSWVMINTSENKYDEIKLDSGTHERNYSLGFDQTTSKLDLKFNFSADNSTPINTPVIKQFKIWTSDSSDKTIEFDKKGDSVKSQIFVDEANGLNISYNSNLIAENITQSKYLFQQTDNSGTLSFSGDANLTVDITNKTIKGDAANQDDIKNVNYPIYENGSKEVTVSTWN